MKRQKHTFKQIVLLLLCALLLLSSAGCGSAKPGRDFTAVLSGDVLTLDPQAADRGTAQAVISEIFEGLCRVNDQGEAVPGVASHWSASQGGVRFTFKLRKARWSDGEAVTAEDFVFGITRALRQETNARNLQDLFIIKNARAVYEGQLPESALGVTAEDDRTLVIDLETAYPDFPLLTAGSHYMPCREDFFEECAGHYGASAAYLLTNGPFTFPHDYAWSTDYNERSIRLVKSDSYRGEREADPASVTYLIDYDDLIDQDPLAALSSEAADVLKATHALADAAREQGYEVITTENAVVGLLLNPKCESLKSLYMRQLFFETLDRQDLLTRGEAIGSEAVGIMPASVQWAGKSYYTGSETAYTPYNDEAAQGIPSLLSGLELERVPSITVLCPDDEASIEVVTGVLIAWNNTLGTAFNMLPLPESELNYRVRTGDYEAALYTLATGGSTPFDVFAAFSGGASLLPEEFQFDSQLSNLAFDRSACRSLEDNITRQYVFYPLFSGQTYYVLAPKAHRLVLLPTGTVEFASGRKTK